MNRSAELMDIIKQLEYQEMLFFTFSAADLHWLNLYKLMPGEDNFAEKETDQKLQNTVQKSYRQSLYQYMKK